MGNDLAGMKGSKRVLKEWQNEHFKGLLKLASCPAKNEEVCNGTLVHRKGNCKHQHISGIRVVMIFTQVSLLELQHLHLLFLSYHGALSNAHDAARHDIPQP